MSENLIAAKAEATTERGEGTKKNEGHSEF
jgi:hypothetical protein